MEIHKSIQCQEPVLVFGCLGSQVLRCDAGLCRAGRAGGREFCPGPSSSFSVSSPGPISVVSSQPSHVSPWHCVIITLMWHLSPVNTAKLKENMEEIIADEYLWPTKQKVSSWFFNPQWQFTHKLQGTVPVRIRIFYSKPCLN